MITIPYHFEPPIQAVNNCRKARWLVLWSLFICAVGQLWIDFSFTNIGSVFIVSTTSAITFHFVVRGSIFRVLPLPALIVIGFNISALSGALIVQTLSFRSLVFNLAVPHTTFFLSAVFQLFLLVTLFIFLKSNTLRNASSMINRRVFTRMGIMQAPTPAQLWLMGFIGCAALLGTGSSEYGDVGGKFIDGLQYLAFAPFIIPVLNKIFSLSYAPPTTKISVRILLIYFIFLIFIAMAKNSRGIFMMGITNLGMVGILLIFLGQLNLKARLKRGLLVSSLFMLMLAPLAADLAIAMVLVRGERSEVSGTELIKLTMSALNDKPAIEEYRQSTYTFFSGETYSETYVSNPFVARFVSTKFFDNTLSYDDVITGARSDYIWNVTINKIGAMLPTPAIQALGLNIDKKDFEFSMGDALFFAQTGTGLGGYRVGSPIGHGMGLMGPTIFIAIIPIFLLVFAATQALTSTQYSIVVISPVILLQIMGVYTLSAGDSLLGPIGLVLRTLPQNILIYWLIFQGTLLITSTFQRRYTQPLLNSFSSNKFHTNTSAHTDSDLYKS